MKILIKNYKLPAIIGIYPHEKNHSQMLFLDIELEADISAAGHSDSIKDTIDYDKVVQLCQRCANTKSHQLLESLANEIVDELFEGFPVLSEVKIVIKKPLAIKDADYAAIEWKKTRPSNRGR